MRPVGFLLYEYDRETASVSIDVLCHEEWTDKKWKKNTAGGGALLRKLEAFYANTPNALITLYADSESVAFYLKQGFKLLNKNEFEMQKQM
jgi:predicted GNAT family N-acyltransferase